MYRLDPFCRDESGRFVRKPDIPPAPLGLVTLVKKRPEHDHWAVRRVLGKDGNWRVLFVYIMIGV
jgi:hypothetical protein